MITLKQLIVAREMAKEYGHMWGNCPTEVLSKAVEAQDVQVIHEAVLRQFWIDNGIDPDSNYQKERSLFHGVLGPGICGPSVVEEHGGTIIEHRSSAGRLGWRINEKGDVEITVYRPDNVVAMQCVIDYDHSSDCQVKVGCDICLRHVYAFHELADAVYDAQAVAECEA